MAVEKAVLVVVLPEIMNLRETVIVVSVLLLILYKILTIFSDLVLDEKGKTLFRAFLKNDSIG